MADIQYGLNPSVDIATATLLGLPAFTGYFSMNDFHALPSDGCIILPQYLFPSVCWPSHLLCRFLGHENALDPRYEGKVQENLLGNLSLSLLTITG
jgi:hypothetical protein